MRIERDAYVQELVERMGNGLIKVVTGLRRSGKTYLLSVLFADKLRELGVDEAHIIAISLDDEANAELRDPHALYDHVLGRIVGDGTHYVFLDEVQYAISSSELRDPSAPPRLYGVLNGLLRRRNVDVYVTGSNSRLLSTDVMTQFRGRGDEVRVHPLSFAEFYTARSGDRLAAWQEYLRYGGMPHILAETGDQRKVAYLTRLFEETYARDILERYQLGRPQELDDLIDVLASAIGSLTNPAKIRATFESILNVSITQTTIAKYLRFLGDSFLVSEARRFDIRGRRRIGSPKKYYFEDLGLRNARLNFRQFDPGPMMENVVYNELRRRGYAVDVGVVERFTSRDGKRERQRFEADFVANLGDQRIYVQSAWTIPDEERRQRETRSLRAIQDGFRKILIVGDPMPAHYDQDGIFIMNVLDFLLDPHSPSA